MNAQAIHPAHGGPDPRAAQQFHAQQRYAQAGYGTVDGGYPPQGHVAPDPAAYHAPRPPRHHADERPRANGSAVLNVAGALVSVALVIGLGVWGYKLAVRDVTGVPVVKALEGPMRIQPEDPGGVVAAHQGLSVNDVPGEGVNAAPVDRLTLAPPAAELSEEDVPAHPDAEVSAAPQRPATAPLQGAPGVQQPAAAPATLPSNGGEINADAAVAEALGLTDIPGLDAPGFDAPATSATEAPASAQPLEVIPESVPGVARSPRPMPRPVSFDSLPEITAPLQAVDVSASASAPAPARPAQTQAPTAPAVVLGYEVEPAEVDPAARLVQLGAYASVEEAREGWKQVAAANPALFQGRNWTIEGHEAGGSPFYRLRALGFDGLEEARAFCAALVAAQGSCVPVIDREGGQGIGQSAQVVTN